MSAEATEETVAAAAATEAATNLNSMQQLEDGDRARRISSTAAVLPASVKGLRRRRRGGFKLSVAALVPVIAAAAVTYLALRCCLSLARANSSSGAHIRFLAGNKQETDKTKWDDCAGAGAEHSAPATTTAAVKAPSPAAPPAAEALVASTPGEKGDDGMKYYLFKKALLNVSDLSTFIETGKPLLQELPFYLRGKCIAAVLCLSIVELSSVLSLLDANERPAVRETIPQLSESIRALRHTMRVGELGLSKERHIIWLHSFLDKLRSAVPPAAAADENERRQKLSELVVLQETVLQQLDSGLHWLQKSLELYKKAQGAAAAASIVAGATTEQTATQSAAAAEERLVAVVRAIEITIHMRRNQALRDPRFTAWMKETQPNLRYGFLRPRAMDNKSKQPTTELQQQLLELQQTPLGQGKDPVLYIQPHEIVDQRREKTATASSGGRKGRRGKKKSRSQGTVAAEDDVSAAAESAAANPDVASSTREASAASGASSAPSPRLVPETLPQFPLRSFSAVVSAASAYLPVFPAPGAAGGTAGAAQATAPGKPMANSAPAGPSSAASASSAAPSRHRDDAASSLSLSQLRAPSTSSFAAVTAQRPLPQTNTSADKKTAKNVGSVYSAATAAMPSSLHRPHSISFPPSSPLPPSSPWPQLSPLPFFDAAATAAAENSAAAPDSSSKLPGVRLRRMQRRGPSSSAVEGTERDARRGAEKGTERAPQTKESQRGTKGSGLAPSDWLEENMDDQQE